MKISARCGIMGKRAKGRYCSIDRNFEVISMLKKLKVIFIVMPYIAMILALITLVKSLFYNFHNDTVPIISIMISCAVSLFCITLVVGTGFCIRKYTKSATTNSRSLWFGITFLLNVVFSAVCLLVHESRLKIIAAYFLITSLSLALSFVFGKININSDLSNSHTDIQH